MQTYLGGKGISGGESSDFVGKGLLSEFGFVGFLGLSDADY
jgi:hypothetical protein